MKKLLFVFLFVSINVYSLETKLECDSKLSDTMSRFSTENKNGLLEVNISEKNNILLIVTDGLLSVGVVNKRNELVYEFTDTSNSNQWSLVNKISFESGDSPTSNKSSIIIMTINRNLGSINIVWDSTYNDGTIRSIKLSGICKKLDTSKRKF